MVVPYPAGGPTDVVGRVVAERMSKSLGQAIIIENVGGADGSIGLGRAARARPDGYTIDFGDMNSHVLNGALYSLPYDVLNDFAAISPLGTIPRVLLARKTMPAKDLNELILWLKANPDKVSVASTSVGYRLILMSLQKEIGTLFTHVPYRGVAPAMQDLVAGQIDLAVGTTTELTLVRAGSLKAYAVTSDSRLSLAPDIGRLPRWGCRGFPCQAGLQFSRRREHRKDLSAHSMTRPGRHWPILRFALGSLNLDWRLCRANDKHQRRSMRWSEAVQTNGGRSSRPRT